MYSIHKGGASPGAWGRQYRSSPVELSWSFNPSRFWRVPTLKRATTHQDMPSCSERLGRSALSGRRGGHFVAGWDGCLGCHSLT